MSLKAVIFDFNGVIINDEPIHLKMFQKVLRKEGIGLSADVYYKKYLAYDDQNCFEMILKESNKPHTPGIIRELVLKKAAAYEEYIKTHLILFPGAKKWVQFFSRKFPLAIASAALKSEIKWILNKANLENHFKVIVSAEDTKRSKPDPESYLLALKKLNRTKKIRPDECLVIEDSINGISGAHRAGMKCLALAHTYKKTQLKEADLVLKNFGGLTFDKIQELFKG